jgi:hypothetical protein
MIPPTGIIIITTTITNETTDGCYNRIYLRLPLHLQKAFL